MRVLPAVLAHAGRVALDVAGVLLAVLVERRGEQSRELVLVVDQQAVDRIHRLHRVFAVGCLAQHAPRLRDGVDAALLAVLRTQRRAVVVVAAAIPRAVPGLLQCRAQRRGAIAPARRARIAACGGHRRQRVDGGQHEPAQPAAFATALRADRVHAVVPVAGADQRQAVRAAGEAGVDRQRAVLVQRRLPVGHFGLEEGIGGAVGDRLALQERQLFVQHRAVAADLDVMHRHIGQPHAIVADLRAHALAVRRQPPVLHVALGKLAPGGAQQVLARQVGAAHAQRHHVLQLVAEAPGAAGLVVRGARPQAAGGDLVQQPVVEQDVERAVGRADLHGVEQVVPLRRDAGEQVVDIDVAVLRHQRARGVLVAAFAEQEDQVELRARRQFHARLQRAARVESGAEATVQRVVVMQGRRLRGAAQRAEETRPVAAERLLRAGQVEERHALAEIGAPAVAGEQRAAGRVARGRHERRRRAAVGAERPFHVAGDRQPPRAAGPVDQAQPRQLDRIVRRHAHGQGQRDAVGVVAELRPALAVRRRAARAGHADRQRAGAPQLAVVPVAQVDDVVRLIADRVVRPRRQRVLLAVGRPAVAAALGGDGAAEMRVGQHVGPRRRRGARVIQLDAVGTAMLDETAVAVGKLLHRLVRCDDRGGRPGADRRSGGWRRGGGCSGGHGVGVDHHARGGEQGVALVGGDGILAQAEQLHLGQAFAALQLRLLRVDARRQGSARGVVLAEAIEHHHVHRQLLRAPPALRQQQRIQPLQRRGTVRAQQCDRAIAGDAQPPQRRCAAVTARAIVRRGALTRIADQQRILPAGEARGLRIVDAELLALPAGACCGIGEQSLGGLRILHARVQRERALARVGQLRPQQQYDAGARREGEVPAQRPYRVEHAAGGAGQRHAGSHRARIAQRAAAAEEARAVGLALGRAGGVAEQLQGLRRPYRGLAVAALAPGGQQQLARVIPVGLHEHLGVRRVAVVVAARAEHQFGVAGQRHAAMAVAVVAQHQPAQFDVGIRRHRHVEFMVQRLVATGVMRQPGRETHGIVRPRHAQRLRGDRPHLAVVLVAQQQKAAPGIGDRVLAPTRHRQFAPAQEAGAVGAQHGGEATVAEQVAGRWGCIGGHADGSCGCGAVGSGEGANGMRMSAKTCEPVMPAQAKGSCPARAWRASRPFGETAPACGARRQCNVKVPLYTPRTHLSSHTGRQFAVPPQLPGCRR